MYQTRDLDRITKQIVSTIEDELLRIGLLFRIFSRVKSYESLNNKINRKGEGYYDGKVKFVNDIIGIRLIFYFSEDVNIIYDRLKEIFEFVDETVDKNEETKFAPTRINLILKLKENSVKEFNDIVNHPKLAPTFEVQLRTILSEGWHEVDHDLRYKCQDDWEKNLDLARNFNGILAALETSEYAILSLFEQLSHRHYKSKNIEAMLRTKFRLRLASDRISDELVKLLSDEIVKKIFKLDRMDFLTYLLNSEIFVPLTMDNLIYIINHRFVENGEILKAMPNELMKS